MQYLISLPEAGVKIFTNFVHFAKASEQSSSIGKWFSTADPKGRKVGSGGGTAWILAKAWENCEKNISFEEWCFLQGEIPQVPGGEFY